MLRFNLNAYIKSQTATRRGINNTPSTQVIKNLKIVHKNIIVPVYRCFYDSGYFDIHKKPFVISSGYRCPKLNRAVGGAKNSQHTKGQAVDFEIIGYPNKDLWLWIQKFMEFDQLILEFYNPRGGPNSGWVHASYVCLLYTSPSPRD